MAELEDLEEHLTAVRSQNASLIGELESLKRQLSAASLSSIDTTIPSASAVPAYRHLGRPASSPMLRRGGSHRPSRTPEAARRLAGGSRRRAATAGAARTTPLAPSLVDFLDSVGLSSSSRTVHVPKGPASVYSPQRPRTPSMMHRCPPKLGTNHPPPRCPPTSRAQTLDVWRKEQDARREADELRWRRHACEGASGASLAKELKERSRRAGLPEQTVTIAGQSRPATAQIDRRRAPLLRKRPPLTRSVASFDATERRLWSTTVSTGLEQQVAALMAAAGGTRPDTAARVAAEVHAAHAASLAARAAAREAAAAGSSGELLVLDDGDSEREAAAPATEEEARSSTSAQESHRAGCRVLLDVIRGWDTSGKCKLPRAHFEFMLSTLAPDVIVDPELQRTLLDECDTREPGVADLRLFCEMLADESNVGRVTFSAELQPNTRRSLRSAKVSLASHAAMCTRAHPTPDPFFRSSRSDQTCWGSQRSRRRGLSLTGTALTIGRSL